MSLVLKFHQKKCHSYRSFMEKNQLSPIQDSSLRPTSSPASSRE
jgi:hypothetical protein